MAEEQNNNNTGSLPGADSPEVQRELSKVSVSFNKSIAIVVVICGIFIYIFYTLFFGTKKEEIPGTQVPSNIVKPVMDVEDNIPEIPKLPDPPKLETPTASPPPRSLFIAVSSTASINLPRPRTKDISPRSLNVASAVICSGVFLGSTPPTNTIGDFLFASRRFFSASLSTSVPEVEGNETGGNGSVLSLFSSTGVVEGKTGGTS
ncbi:MAG: hypothetical protein O7C62_07780, partial [Rickettsia endosymbiont of Ixodes persulcatus]|nr:hypothetical protein [Rickettsia endosymbiont of Ixodes persulcatus]